LREIKETDKETGMERRSRIRVLCEPNSPPALKIKDQIFTILDISRSGIRVSDQDDQLKDEGPIRLTIKFPNDDIFILDGMVIWSSGNECGIKLKSFLPETMVKRSLKS
jgi:hypothetical protein